MIKTDCQQTKEAFLQAARTMATRGLMRCSSGNLSLRLQNNKLLSTASRSWMENLSLADISVCQLSDGKLLEGRKPTVEIGFHSAILRNRNDLNVILHFQSPYATTLACQQQEMFNFFVIPEIPYYIGQIALVPYLPPGSGKLATAVTTSMQNHNLTILSNHGIVTAGKNFLEARQRAEFFELACQIIVNSGKDLKTLPDEAVQRLLEAGRTAQNAS